MLENYRHFNAASTVDAAAAYTDFVDEGGSMFLTLVRPHLFRSLLSLLKGVTGLTH